MGRYDGMVDRMTAVLNGTDDPEELARQKAAGDQAQQAQAERAKKHGIAPKESGHLTKPSEFADVAEEHYGDPTNFKLPMGDLDHANNAASRLAQEAFRKEYSDKELAVIEARVKARQRELAPASAKAIELHRLVEKALGDREWGDLSADERDALISTALSAGLPVAGEGE